MNGRRRGVATGTDGLEDEEGRAVDVPGWCEVMGIRAR